MRAFDIACQRHVKRVAEVAAPVEAFLLHRLPDLFAVDVQRSFRDARFVVLCFDSHRRFARSGPTASGSVERAGRGKCGSSGVFQQIKFEGFAR